MLRRLSLLGLAQRRARGPAQPVLRATPVPSPGDVAAFLEAARRSFVCIQQAWDRADLAALSAMASGPLLEELRSQLAERGPGPNHTEVIRVEARLLAVENLCEAQLASVEFSGLIRERQDACATPFRELWMLARPQRADAGWQVARVQALG
ncbi:MAG: 39S ribosomal protein L45 [Proteobacteria bacterium]|nr:39S ribosomal protein L45 [Pseudomonadota bacterium]